MQLLPWIKVGNGFKGLRVGQQFIQHVDDVHKARALGAVVKPALKHKLVHCRGAVHGRRQAERLVNGLHHLRQARGWESV